MKKCTGGGSDLPEELLPDILLLLPAKSLMRFRSVSKLWLSIISDPQFISSFFNSANPKLLLTVPESPPPDGYPFGQFIYSLDYSECCRRDQPSLTTVTSHGLVPRKSVRKVQVSHSSGGLVCMEFGYSPVVCNPSTREYVFLPWNPIDSLDNKHKCFNHFGFDPVENKCKLLRTLQLEGEEFYVFVLTLGGVGEQWRRLDDAYPTSYLVNEDFSTRVVQHHGAGVCINGVLYYLSMQNRILIAFDVRLETFELIPLPADVVGLSNSFLMESDDGCLALVNMMNVYHKGIDEEEEVKDEIAVYTLVKDDQLWKCERFAVPDELRKLIQTVTLVGTTHNGELLYATSINSSSGKSNLYVCNLKDASLKKIEVDGLPKDQNFPPGIHHLRVCNYVENLISQKPRLRLSRTFLLKVEWIKNSRNFTSNET